MKIDNSALKNVEGYKKTKRTENKKMTRMINTQNAKNTQKIIAYPICSGYNYCENTRKRKGRRPVDGRFRMVLDCPRLTSK